MTRLGKCDWCGTGLESGEGWRLIKPSRNMGAAFCRLEHVVPWMTRKNDWHILEEAEVPAAAEPVCAESGVELDDSAVYLVRTRDGVEIADGFAGAEEALRWARAGGRYRP